MSGSSQGSGRLRVAFVCQWYPPEPAEVPRGIATALAEAGCDVTVLTGVPNYPTGAVAAGYSARRSSREVLDGLPVRRTPLYPSHDRSAVRRLANYASWALSSAVLGQALLRTSSVALVYSSPATAALPAMVARRLWGTPYVLLVQDVWPDSVFASGFLTGVAGRLARRVLNVFVDLTYRGAHHVAVTSPGMVDLLAARGVPRDKLSVVHNWVQEGPTADVPPETVRRVRASWGVGEDDFVLMYAGNHGRAQALEPVVEAFAEMTAEDDCHLVLVGDGVTRPGLVERYGAHRRIRFVDPVPQAEVAALVQASDAQLVSLADEALFAVTMPSKVQSILAAGLPLVVSARGDSAEVVTSARAGLAVAPGDRPGLRDAVRRLAATDRDERRTMGRRGREWYDAHMSRRVGSESLRQLLARAAEGRRR
ncbi:glycosyltransferase family 4 protein [Nocardioides renjunii]|uniref:glycosyltransferase family 4 protein n=1 Tax=Nocardioides renjunii TaxID=3095075 RepID=UPI002AFEDC87|nr:glycosyltransferase family 4 protein [Nocardioides sp. S-34]WQQ22153.1 glycosyltransferase family 4 protein [Nocardioides sp. S-34]